MQETNQLTNKVDGKETHKHTLDEEKSPKQKVEEHVRSDFDNTGEWVRLLPCY